MATLQFENPGARVSPCFRVIALCITQSSKAQVTGTRSDVRFVCARAKWLRSCPTLCDRTHCSPPDPSVHEILQARTLEWVATPSSRGSSRPRDRTGVSFVSCIDRWVPGMMFTASRFPQCPGAHAESAGYARSVQLGRWQLRFPDSRSWVSRFDPSSLGKDPFRSGLFRLAPAL